MDGKITAILDKMIRVNLAGETGAKHIYSSQIRHSKTETNDLERQLSEELRHLEYFRDFAKNNQIRPTAMSPIWRQGARLMGFLTAKLGNTAIDGCTVGVEEVISRHYFNQINEIDLLMENELDDSVKLKLSELRLKISEFMEDETYHLNDSIEKNQNQDIRFKVTKAISSILTAFAIKVSEKI